MSVYLPDELAAEVKDELGETNISGICQDALRAELERTRARAKVTGEGFDRVEVYDGRRERDVAFEGREIANSYTTDQAAYLTPKDAIVITDAADDSVSIFDDWDALDNLRAQAIGGSGYAEDLIQQIADALGEKYVEDLDI